jgi:hypothetical protein
MKTKPIFIFVAVVALATVAALVTLLHQPKTVVVRETNLPQIKTVSTVEPQPAAVISVMETNPEIAFTSAEKTSKPKKGASKNSPSAKSKPPLQDPDARAALSLVGVNADAEAYWLSAISDPSLPQQEREDLMEDLNEDGFADPKHPSADEIPLIINRIALIEQIAPGADPFVQEHLGEAYKDLNNMLAGNPVK